MMTEADEFFEKTAMKAEEPMFDSISESEECEALVEDSVGDDESFFDETYADQTPVFQPKTKKEAIKRLKMAEQQFENGQWHTLEEVMDMVRRNIA
ncbi:MAG: hypothetical protein IK075_09470 [Prevotella sp.]|nr:hypothetical protein [Prevotella sp.]